MTEFVPRFYVMNPETDILVMDGRVLSEGMKVLIENPHERAVLRDSRMEDWEIDRALERNRWCTVSQIKITGNLLRFVATYEDDTQRLRKASVDDAWIAKKDSIGESTMYSAARYLEVYTAVLEALTKAENGVTNPQAHEYNAATTAEAATKRILDLL